MSRTSGFRTKNLKTHSSSSVKQLARYSKGKNSISLIKHLTRDFQKYEVAIFLDNDYSAIETFASLKDAKEFYVRTKRIIIKR